MRISQTWRLLVAVLAISATSCSDLPNEPLDAPEITPSAIVIDGYTIVREKLRTPLPNLVASKLIGVGGGKLNIQGHSLTIPAGAIDHPTLFTMTISPVNRIEVDLTALAIPIVGDPFAVTTFNQALRLQLTYHRSPDRNTVNPANLVIINVEGEQAEPARSRAYPANKTVAAQIWHFSKYMMASN
jgi:hypothetical protein